MPENLLIPSVDLRIGALEEYNRRQRQRAGTAPPRIRPRPVITLSREFGCEAYPVAERLQQLMTERSGEEWLLMDKALLEEVALCNNISEEILRNLGERNGLLEDVLATFSPLWKSQKECFDLLCRHMLALAHQGNVILVGRGSAIVTRHLKHCHHFRLYASIGFKRHSLARRLNMHPDQAEALMERKQKLRDRFTSDFLGEDARDMNLYSMLFSNDRNSAEQIARSIADHVAAG